MQATELRYNYSYGTSDTYSTAYLQALEVLGVQPVSNSMLDRMDLLSRELATALRDSSEVLRDVRKICRRAVIDAIRTHLGIEIDRIIANLDEIRMREVSSTILDRAICAAFGARVNLTSAPFRETLRQVETARALLDNLTGACLSGEYVGRMQGSRGGVPLSFEIPRLSDLTIS